MADRNQALGQLLSSLGTEQGGLPNPVGDLLTNLLRGTGQAVKQLPEQTLQALLRSEPVSNIAQIAGAASVKPPENILQAQAQQRLAGMDVLRQAQQKELEKLAKKQVTDAVEQGVPVEQIQQQLDQMDGQNITPQGTAQVPGEQGVTQTPSQAPVNNLLEQLGGFLSSGGGINEAGEAVPSQILGGLIREAPSSVLQRQQAQALTPRARLAEAQAEFQTEVKLETVKSALKIQEELAKKGNPDALTPENAGKFSLLKEGRQATIDIDSLLGDNVTQTLIAQGVPTFLKSQNARLLQSAIERAVQGRTRIETGAALQPSELKSTAKRFMPRTGDSIQTALKRIRPLFDFFEGSLNIADPTGIHRQRARGIQQTTPGTIKVTSVKQIGE